MPDRDPKPHQRHTPLINLNFCSRSRDRMPDVVPTPHIKHGRGCMAKPASAISHEASSRSRKPRLASFDQYRLVHCPAWLVKYSSRQWFEATLSLFSTRPPVSVMATTVLNAPISRMLLSLTIMHCAAQGRTHLLLHS